MNLDMHDPQTIILIMEVLIGVIIALCIFLIVWQYWRQIKDVIRIRKHRILGDKLLIDYYKIPEVVFSMESHKKHAEERYRWVGREIQETDIYRQGYYRAVKWMDNLRYSGIPVYVRLHNFKIIDPVAEWQELGLEEPNKLTSSILYNVYENQTMKRNVDGITRVKFAAMDSKMMMLAIPLIILGVVAAAYFLGVI